MGLKVRTGIIQVQHGDGLITFVLNEGVRVHGCGAALGIQIDGIFHIDDPRLWQLVVPLVGLLVVGGYMIAIIFAEDRIQDLRVVIDPRARSQESGQQDDRQDPNRRGET